MTNGALPETKWSGLPALHSGPTLIGKTRRNSRKKRKKMRTTAINDINELCDFVRETAFAIHRYHRHGHLEKVYENALAHRLRKAKLDVQQQYPLKVLDEDGTSIGEYFADLIVGDVLIVELKACRTLVAEHVAQMLGYLRSAKKEHGLLMNFGGYRFQIRKYAMSHESLEV